MGKSDEYDARRSRLAGPPTRREYNGVKVKCCSYHDSGGWLGWDCHAQIKGCLCGAPQQVEHKCPL